VVGVVTQVIGHTALVKLLDHRQSWYHVVLGKSGQRSLAQGQGNGRIELMHLGWDVVVAENEAVWAVVNPQNDTQQDSPQRVLLGYVSKVSHAPHQNFQQVMVRPAVNIGQLAYVMLPMAQK